MRKLRNIAIIAHVDHGKTTLVDKMIMQGNLLRDNEHTGGDLIMDNNDIERERGITILSKNVSVIYRDYKINIIDTPGHADFGGEVERVLNMCDGVILLVDAFEGTMPQTRFVLQKALSLGKKPIVVINKVDKENCRPDVVNEQVFDLMFTLGATEEQLDYKTIYGSAKQGWMSHVVSERTDSICPLLDTIIDEIPEPEVVEGTVQMLVTSLEYSPYVGRIAVGKVTRGSLTAGQNVTLAKRDGTLVKSKIKDLMVFEGLGKAKAERVECGEICALVGIDGFEIPSATLSTQSHCLQSLSMSLQCRCSLPSITRHSSVRMVSTLHRAISRSASIESLRRTLRCVLSQDRMPTHLWCMVVVSCTSLFLSRLCAARAMSCRWVSQRLSQRRLMALGASQWRR